MKEIETAPIQLLPFLGSGKSKDTKSVSREGHGEFKELLLDFTKRDLTQNSSSNEKVPPGLLNNITGNGLLSGKILNLFDEGKGIDDREILDGLKSLLNKLTELAVKIEADNMTKANTRIAGYLVKGINNKQSNEKDPPLSNNLMKLFDGQDSLTEKTGNVAAEALTWKKNKAGKAKALIDVANITAMNDEMDKVKEYGVIPKHLLDLFSLSEREVKKAIGNLSNGEKEKLAKVWQQLKKDIIEILRTDTELFSKANNKKVAIAELTDELQDAKTNKTEEAEMIEASLQELVAWLLNTPQNQINAKVNKLSFEEQENLSQILQLVETGNIRQSKNVADGVEKDQTKTVTTVSPKRISEERLQNVLSSLQRLINERSTEPGNNNNQDNGVAIEVNKVVDHVARPELNNVEEKILVKLLNLPGEERDRALAQLPRETRERIQILLQHSTNEFKQGSSPYETLVKLIDLPAVEIEEKLSQLTKRERVQLHHLLKTITRQTGTITSKMQEQNKFPFKEAGQELASMMKESSLRKKRSHISKLTGQKKGFEGRLKQSHASESARIQKSKNTTNKQSIFNSIHRNITSKGSLKKDYSLDNTALQTYDKKTKTGTDIENNNALKWQHLIQQDKQQKNIGMHKMDTSTPRPQQDLFQVGEQITRQIKMVNFRNNRQMEMQLEPEFLGKVRLQVKVEKGQVTVHFEVENSLVKEQLEQNIHHLRSNFLRQGLTVDQIHVETEEHQPDFKENEQQQHNQQNFAQEQQKDEANREEMPFAEVMKYLAEKEDLPPELKKIISYYQYRSMDILV